MVFARPPSSATAAWPLSVYQAFAVKAWKHANRLAHLLFGYPNVVQRLQIQPELRASPKEMAESQGGVASDAACAVQDLRHAIGGHGDVRAS